MKKWEYKEFRVPVGGKVNIEAELNKLGSEGWELVNILNVNYFYLKREVEGKGVINE